MAATQKLTLRWCTGFAELNLERIFPAPKATMAKLRKLILLDPVHAPEAIQIFLRVIKSEIARQTERRESAHSRFLESQAMVLDLTDQLDTGTTKEGVPLSREVEEIMRGDLRTAKRRADSAAAEYRRARRQIDRLRTNAKIIMRWGIEG